MNALRRKLKKTIPLGTALAVLGMLLVPGGPASAAATGALMIQSAGHVAVTNLGSRPGRATRLPHLAAPHLVRDPAAHRLAKERAAASHGPGPSAPAGQLGPHASLFNNLNQPGLSVFDEGFCCVPPDPTGAVGPNHYVQMVNSLIGVYSKSNLSLLSSMDTAAFTAAPSGLTLSDPQIEWDFQANRWFYLAVAFATGNNFLVFGWSKTRASKNPPALGSTSALEAFGITGLPADPRIAGGLPTQLITGYSDLGRQATNPQWQYPTVWNPKVNYTWLLGPQSLKAGYEFQRVDVEVMDVNPLYGRDSYTGQFSRPGGIAANNLYNLADFMVGLRSQYALSNPLVADMRRNMHFVYLQDDVHASDRLTLNLGVRYEYATPLWEANNVLSNFDPAGRQMVLARDGSIDERALVKPDRNNFGPRLGVAFTPMRNTTLHGGWGISYVHNQRTGAADLLPINGPQVINAVVTQTSAVDPNFRPTEQGYPAGLTDLSKFNPLAANISYIPADYHSGRVQSWFASIQRELRPGMLLDLAYVGNRADDLVLIGNYNQAAVNDAAGSIALQARRPIPQFADITYVFNGGKSRYHAFQTKYEWRFRSDMTVLSSLTLSKTKDNGAQSLENQNGNFPGPQNIDNLAAEYATGAYDQPYNSTTSFVWSLPIGRNRRWGSGMSAALDAVAGGWQVAGINTVTSAEPVTLTYSPAASFVVSGIQQDFRGANNYRPNLTCDPYASAAERSITNWFNKACVVIRTDPSQPFGNAPRNNVHGPNFWTFDLAAVKEARVAGETKLQLRVEAFNLFNRVNLAPPNGNRSSGGFGTITAAYDPRQVQLGVKLLW